MRRHNIAEGGTFFKSLLARMHNLSYKIAERKESYLI